MLWEVFLLCLGRDLGGSGKVFWRCFTGFCSVLVLWEAFYDVLGALGGVLPSLGGIYRIKQSSSKQLPNMLRQIPHQQQKSINSFS